MTRIIKIPQGGGGNFEYQTEITTNTTLTTQEGLNKVYGKYLMGGNSNSPSEFPYYITEDKFIR